MQIHEQTTRYKPVAGSTGSRNNTLANWSFVGNHSKILRASALQNMADHSPQAEQAARLQAMADGYAAQEPSVIHTKTEPSAWLSLTESYPDLQSPSPGQSSDLPVIQRKVYIDDGDEVIEKRQSTDVPEINRWINDSTHRHFIDDQEMRNYQRGYTIDIGTVGPKKSWVRLNQKNGLLVVGENHIKTTMDDMVKALKNNSYTSEAYTYMPDDRAGEFPGLARENTNSQHNALELIFPKLAHGMLLTIQLYDQRFRFSYGSKAYDYLKEVVNNTFFQGLLMAKDVYNQVGPNASPARSALSDEWRQKQEIWEQTMQYLSHEKSDLTKYKNRIRSSVTRHDILRMARLLLNFLLEDSQLHPEPGATQESVEHRVTRINEDIDRRIRRHETAENEIMTWRERYMLKKIIDASNEGRMLAGIGEKHRQNLADKLNGEGIKHIYMEELLTNATQENKRTAAKAKKEKRTG